MLRAVARLLPLQYRGSKLSIMPMRAVSRKVIEHGGISRKGDFPGLPQNTSTHTIVPGESEEPDQYIGGRSWLGELEDPPPPPPFGTWTQDSKRSGAIGRKMGMMNVYDARGVKTLCTVIKLEECQVVEVKKYISGRGEPRINLSIGAGVANMKQMLKCQIVPFRKAGVQPKKVLRDFNVTHDAVLPVGHFIDARHFVPGQFVDIQGKSRGKGFAGAMKKWGFDGQFASHGNSLCHRAIGSTGSTQDPGRVWPGKKMPGRLGNNKVTFKNMLIYKVDVARNLVFLKGSVPGAVKTFVRLKDSVQHPWQPWLPPPFPTFKPQPGDESVNEVVMDVSHLPLPLVE